MINDPSLRSSLVCFFTLGHDLFIVSEDLSSFAKSTGTCILNIREFFLKSQTCYEIFEKLYMMYNSWIELGG